MGEEADHRRQASPVLLRLLRKFRWCTSTFLREDRFPAYSGVEIILLKISSVARRRATDFLRENICPRIFGFRNYLIKTICVARPVLPLFCV